MSLAIAIAGVLVHLGFIELMAKAAQENTLIRLYSGYRGEIHLYGDPGAGDDLVPLSYIGRWVDRITPAVTKNFLKPMLIVLIAPRWRSLLIGPLGIWIGSAIFALVYTIHSYLGWLSVAIMGGLWPLLVMTGMHRVFTPTIIQTIAETGKEGMVMPSEIGANLSLGGSSLAVAWKTKTGAAPDGASRRGIGDSGRDFRTGAVRRGGAPEAPADRQQSAALSAARWQVLPDWPAIRWRRRGCLPACSFRSGQSNDHRLGVWRDGAVGGAVVCPTLILALRIFPLSRLLPTPERARPGPRHPTPEYTIDNEVMHGEFSTGIFMGRRTGRQPV